MNQISTVYARHPRHNFTVPGAQLAKDFGALAAILDELFEGDGLANPFIVGPDIVPVFRRTVSKVSYPLPVRTTGERINEVI